MRLRWLGVVALLLTACGDSTLRWEYAFEDPATEAAATTLVARILSGGCGGGMGLMYEVQLPAGSPADPATPSPPALAPGTYGFELAARNDLCHEIARGCSEAGIDSSGRVFVLLITSAAGEDCDVSVCDGGVCPPTMMPPMCTAEICNGLDDDCDDAIDEMVDVSSDPRNCGACGMECTVPNGLGTCAAGACTPEVSECDPGWRDCRRRDPDGCESDRSCEDEQ